MSKELVISAASHERRVAILEEGQLVEIYIEREKEFALVGSIYKGRVTRVLPGMQSAFVDIGLDGDAFLYVSDVFENLEDYDHDHGHGHAPQASSPIPPAAALVEALPGESLANAHGSDEAAPLSADDAAQQAIPHEEPMRADFAHEHEASEAEGTHGEAELDGNREAHAEAEERQPDSNASAPQNFGQFNPTQKYSRPDRGNARGGQDSRGDRGGDSGRGGRWGRRGGRRRGGRPQGGRNLPPAKYASPQGDQRPHDSRGGYDSRGPQPRSFEPRDNRRPEGSRYSPPAAPASSGEDEIVLPGESLAKYRNKPTAAAAPAPAVIEPEIHEPQPDLGDSVSSRGNVQQTGTPSGANVPRRSSGGLPRWLLAETGNEAETSSTGTEELTTAADDTATTAPQALAAAANVVEQERTRTDASLSDEDVAVISSSLIEAKHEETQAHAAADTLVGGAVFEEEEQEEEEEGEVEEEGEGEGENEEETEESADEHDEIRAREAEAESHDVGAEEIAAIETRALDAHALAEAEADAAHESALHAAAIGDHVIHEESAHEPVEATGTESAPLPAVKEDDSILLPGETRAPRSGAPEPRQDFPRDSARIGGNPRARFQRPYRSGGRDRDNRGRDNRGGGGGRPDRRGGRPGPGGPRFERRPGGPQRHQGGHTGPSRRPQLISEMLKAGQDIVIQIAKEPLGKKGARITSHVALPGRFLVYMPTIDHIGVSRKIASAENRSRLRRLVGEARGAYPGGFIVRTAAGGASDEEIRTDIEFLGKTWNEIKERSEQRKSPALLHRDLNLVERILRDYVSDDFSAIWIDSEEEYGKVVEFVSRFQPKLVNRVKLYTKETPIFEEFGIQHELDKALRAKVWLKSGGYIVINHTEALVAIDVNTGKFVGKGSTRLEDTIVKTNLEAVKEIVRQIRLRDLGGIIVVDFIDMEERRNREKVLMALQQALEQDKAPSKALSFNEFGLVCITRKRTKQALERVLCQPCPYCTGSGMVKSIPTLCYEIQAEARKMAAATADNEAPNLTLRVHPEIAKALKTRESMLIDELEQTTHKHVIIQSDATLHWEQYDIC
jgi:Rne/Rng family ribonuclease